jgi:hypothetical protein
MSLSFTLDAHSVESARYHLVAVSQGLALLIDWNTDKTLVGA